MPPIIAGESIPLLGASCPPPRSSPGLIECPLLALSRHWGRSKRPHLTHSGHPPSLTSRAARSSIQPWGPRSPHEAQAEASRSAPREGTHYACAEHYFRRKLLRLVGTPKCPTLIDVRSDAEFEVIRILSPPRVTALSRLRGSALRPPASSRSWLSVRHGTSLSQGVAAWLRDKGVKLRCWKVASQPGSTQIYIGSGG